MPAGGALMVPALHHQDHDRLRMGRLLAREEHEVSCCWSKAMAAGAICNACLASAWIGPGRWSGAVGRALQTAVRASCSTTGP